MEPIFRRALRDKYAAAFLVILIFFGLSANAQQYHAGAHVVVNDAIGPAQKTPVDSRQMFYDSLLFLYRPFQSTAEAISYFPNATNRFGNYILIIDSGGTLQSNGSFLGGYNTFWMWKDSTTNAGLVKLNLLGSSGCSGCLLAANNLSDLPNAGLGRSNLGLGSIATFSATALGTDVTGTWPAALTVNSIQGHNLAYLTNYANLTNTPPLVSLTTTGTSGVATYNSGTGVLNIPNYSGSGGSCLNCNADTIGNIPLNFVSFCNGCVLTLDSTAGYAYWAPSTGGVASLPPNSGSGFRIYSPQIPGIRSLVCASGCTIDSTTNTGSLTFTVTSSGTGTVTSFSAVNITGFATQGVTNATTTPQLSYTLVNAPAYNIWGNNTSSSGTPFYFDPNFSILNQWAAGTIALLGNNQVFTGTNQFNNTVLVGANVTFTADNTWQIGSIGAAASVVYSRELLSNSGLIVGSGASSAISFDIGGATNAQLLSTGQLLLSEYNTPTSFTGTATSIAAFDVSGHLIQISPTFTVPAVQGLHASVTGDSVELGGFLFMPDTIATLGYAFNITGLPDKSTLLSTDSVLIETISGQLYKVPSSAIGGGGGTPGGSNTQVQFNNSGAFGGSSSLTWNGSTLGTTGLALSGSVTLTATNTYSIGTLADEASQVYTQNVSSNGNLALSACSTCIIPFAFNGTQVGQVSHTGQWLWNSYISATAFTLGTPVGATLFDASGNIGTTGLTGTGNVVLATSPTFTGTPTLPTGTIVVTQSPGNNTTAPASTAFVTAAVAAGGGSSPSGYQNQVQIDSAGHFGQVANFTANATTHVVNSDTISAHKAILDSARFSKNLIPKARLAPVIWDDNSYGAATGATLQDSGYAYRFRDTMNVPMFNFSLGGTGCYYYETIAAQNDNGPYNSNVLYVGSSFNDIRASSGTDQRTYNKQAALITSLFVNHFATRYVSASDLTSATSPQITTTGHVIRYGAGWTTGQNAQQYGGKLVGGAAIDNAANDSIVYQGYGPAFGINMIAGDGNVFVHSTIQVYVDYSLYRTIDLDSIADGWTVNSHADTRIAYGIVIAGLTNSFHSIKLVNTQAHFMFVDYFAALDFNKPSYIVSNVPQPATVTIAAVYVNKMNTLVDSVFATLPANAPAFTYPVNDFFCYTCNGGEGYTDNVHPNNLGHQKIMESLVHTWDSISSNLPNTIYTDSMGNPWMFSQTRGAVRLGDFINSINTGTNYQNINGTLNLNGIGSQLQFNGYNGLRMDSLNYNWYSGAGPGDYNKLNTSQYNTVAGIEACWYCNLYYNTAFGARAGRGASGMAGQQNTSIGAFAARDNQNGITNTAGGYDNQLFQNGGSNNSTWGASFATGVSASSNFSYVTGMGSNTLTHVLNTSKILAFGVNVADSCTTCSNVDVICNYGCEVPNNTVQNWGSWQHLVFINNFSANPGQALSGGQVGIGKIFPAFGLDIARAIAVLPDSLPYASSTTATMLALVIDTTGGIHSSTVQVKQVPVSALSSSTSPFFVSTANGSALTNTTSATDLVGTGTGSGGGTTVVPSTSLTVGRTIHLNGSFVYSTGASNTSFVILTGGGVTGNAIQFPFSQTNAVAIWNVDITILSTGSSGTCAFTGTITFPNQTPDVFLMNSTGTTTATINTTSGLDFQPVGVWTTASSSNSIQSTAGFVIKVQ